MAATGFSPGLRLALGVPVNRRDPENDPRSRETSVATPWPKRLDTFRPIPSAIDPIVSCPAPTPESTVADASPVLALLLRNGAFRQGGGNGAPWGRWGLRGLALTASSPARADRCHRLSPLRFLIAQRSRECARTGLASGIVRTPGAKPSRLRGYRGLGHLVRSIRTKRPWDVANIDNVRGARVRTVIRG
jgi:hypothetical protein